MSIAKFALDQNGRVMMTVSTVTNATRIAAQAYLMDAACVDAGAVAAGDSFNAGFRYTVDGALRVFDATGGLPASSSVNQGVAMTDDGQACYTTDAIGADVARLNGAAIDSDGKLYATVLDPVAWFRFNVGITETGQGVSTWADQSGEGNDLLQATDGARPPKQSDGSILFNGTDEYLKCGAFTLNQPETVYMLGRQVTWVDGNTVWDGNAGNDMRLFNADQNPTIYLYAGAQAAGNSDFTVNTYAVACAVYNGASSVLQINNNASTTGNAGAANGSGFTLGAFGNGATAFSNIQVKEVILFPVAHDAATRLHQIRYLAHNGPVVL